MPVLLKIVPEILVLGVHPFYAPRCLRNQILQAVPKFEETIAQIIFKHLCISIFPNIIKIKQSDLVAKKDVKASVLAIFWMNLQAETAMLSGHRSKTESVEVEPTTKVKFLRSIVAPGRSEALSLVGTGFREKSIAFIRVKVYAIGLYLDKGISTSLVSWKGKGVNELSKDNSFFKAVVGAPVEKTIKIVLVRDVDGATFWGALDEALTPRLNAASAGAAGQEALDAFGKVFQGKSLKQGTSIYLTWVQPFMLQVAVSGDGVIPATSEATIISIPLVSALYDVYLGEGPVSPTAKLSVAAGVAALL